MQKWVVFQLISQTLIKHQFYFYFLYELLMSLRSDHTAQ